MRTEDLDRYVSAGPMSAELNAEEGFMWSRIGSGIRVRDLLSLCPWPEEQSFKIFDSLLKKKSARFDDDVIERLSGFKIKSPPKKEVEKKSPEIPAAVKEQLQMDQFEAHSRDLDLDFRTDILLRLHYSSEQSPYEVLGVKRTATPNEIKLKYIELSRKFHPDRFFRKNLGVYKRKLEKLFTLIQQAHASLKNPYDRENLDRKLKLKDSAGTKTTKLDPKKLDPRLEKVGKAEHHYRLGIECQRKGDLIAAYNSFALATQLNPEKEIYSKALKEIEPLLHQGKAKNFIEKAINALDVGLFNDALEAAKQAVKLDPESGEAAYLAAKSIIELGLDDEMENAIHLLRRAKTKMPLDADPCVLLGRVYQARRDKTRAKQEYEAALKRNPGHTHAKKLLSKLES